MMLTFLKALLVGRPEGLRSRLRARIFGAPAGTNNAPSPTRGAPAAAPPVVEAAEKSLALKKEPPRDVTPPDGYEVVLHKDALEAGRIIEIIIGGTAIAVANVAGTFYATSNTCPHADGPLGEGALDGCIVACPYHGWQFDVRDGSCKTNPYAKVATYPVQLVGNAVCVKL
jgi:nitrite reductase/ring-hydroxylating ferredoxin subunit